MSTGASYWNSRTLDFQKVHPRLRIIRRLFDAIPAQVRTVLDVGCGPATIRDILPSHIEYFGVDFAQVVIDAFRDPVHYEVADINASPRCFGARRFDVIICSGIFEYVKDPVAFVEFLEAKSHVGGHLLLSYTNRQHYKSVPAMVRGARPTYVDEHYNFVSIPQAMRVLTDHGFHVLTHTAITDRRKRVLPVFSRFTRFPFSMLNRQFVFLCRYEESAEAR